MPTSTSTIFGRVNRRRPCRICGKPDWCSFSRDEQFSICMRVSEGARKINRQGGAIFIHEDRLEETPIDAREVIQIVQSPIAPIEARDFVYGRLIQLSPVELHRCTLINGKTGLLARGLDERHFGSYGGLPAEWRARERIARQLQLEANEYFHCADSLRGIPGFWEDHRGAHLWKERDYLAPRLLIPVRGEAGRIQACQMRLPFVAKNGLRYLWLSSSDLPLGCGSGSPLHFKFRLAHLPRDAWIVIVEGVLKADVLSLIARRMRSEGTLATTRIASWDHQFKGIDDAAIHNIPISSISVRSWLDSLSPHFRRIAMTRFTELGAFPFQMKNKGGLQAVVAEVPAL